MGEPLPGVGAALDAAQKAFDEPPGGFRFNQRLDPTDDDADVVQLQTACRLLAACRTLREPGGYDAAVGRLAFAAIDRSLEAYAFARDDAIGDLRAGRAEGYSRAADRGLIAEETADRLADLDRVCHDPTRRQDSVPSAEQATALVDLATAVHDAVAEAAERSHECHCE